MLEMIKELSLIDGISGREDAVREYIIEKTRGFVQSSETDSLGNLIMFKKGRKTPKNKVMLDAHMDEVGMMVSYINEDGTLEFECVGGIDKRVMLGRAVRVGGKVNGVIGVKPIHLLSESEKLEVPKHLYIDIGAKGREEAEKYVELGDYVCFNSEFVSFGNSLIKGKALDDRAGCAMLIEMIRQEQEYDLYFSFSSCEETGSGAAGAAAFTVRPDYAIVAETTTAADLADVPPSKRVCSLGDGPAISFMDLSTVYSNRLYRRTLELAKQKGIKAQTKAAVAGGNNSGSIHKTAGGIKTVSVSLPCRYLHSPSCVLSMDDVREGVQLLTALAEDLAND